MTIPKIYFDLDLIGTSSANRVTYERAVLPTGVIRLIIPKYGAYYAETLQVYSVNSSNVRTLLTRNTDYACVELLSKMTADVGKEIFFVILVTNTALGATFDYSYNALGGEDAVNAEAVVAAFAEINLNLQPVTWTYFIGKPIEFAPGAHLHDSLDLYGMEYISNALLRIKDAVVVGDTALHGDIVNRADSALLLFQNVTFNQNLDDVNVSTQTTEGRLLDLSKRLDVANANTASAVLAIATVEAANKKFKLNNFNAAYAQVLEHACKKQITKNGVLISIPDKIDNLQLWIDVGDATKVNDNTTGMILYDKSSNSRVFTADVSTKPTIGLSSSGLTGNVLTFTNGKCLTLSAGSPIALSSAATVFTVTSGFGGYHRVQVLSDSNNNGLFVKLNEGKALTAVDNAGNTNYHAAATIMLHSGPSVTVVGTENTNNNTNYAYTTHPASLETTPSGFVDSASNFNNISFTLNKIGNSNNTVLQSGELACLLVYNRQLSKYEVDTVLEYLYRRYNVTVNLLSNGDFGLGLDNFQTDYSAEFNVNTRGSITVSNVALSLLFPSNPVVDTSVANNNTIIPYTGNYLAVNSSVVVNKVFWSETVKLDTGVTYEFSFSLAYGAINKPNIRFYLNGVVHTKVVTLNANTGRKQDIKFMFKATQDLNVLSLINNNISSTGNNFGIDHIVLVRRIYAVNN
jgi:hypothetical protein